MMMMVIVMMVVRMEELRSGDEGSDDGYGNGSVRGGRRI